MATFGHPQSDWDTAKNQALSILYDVARREKIIYYSELTNKVTAIRFLPEGHDFHMLLDEISREEHNAGRGLLSVVVVKKSGDPIPGPGFFALAQDVGKDTRDKVQLWASEADFVYKSHKK